MTDAQRRRAAVRLMEGAGHDTRGWWAGLPDRLRNVFQPEPTISWQDLQKVLTAIDSDDAGPWRVTLDHPALVRCLALSTSVVAQLLSSPRLRVQDRDGKTVRKPAADRILRIIGESPDGVLDSYRYWARQSYDHLSSGNALQRIVRGPRGQIQRLERQRATWFEVEEINGGRDLIYRVTRQGAYQALPDTELLSHLGVIHAQWPIPQGRNPYRARSPLAAINKALKIAAQSDEFVGQFFADGPGGAMRSRTAITTPEGTSIADLEKFIGFMERAKDSRLPLLLLAGMDMKSVKDDPADEKLTKLREFQIREIVRAYGVPAPLIGEMVTQWGSGIEQLAKLAYRFGFRQHLDAILKPMSTRLLPYGQSFAIDDHDIARGDTQALAGLISVMRQTGDMERSEARLLAGLSADGGEDRNGSGEAEETASPGVPADPGDRRGSPPVTPR